MEVGDAGVAGAARLSIIIAAIAIAIALLADTDKEVAAAYGTLGPIGFPRRSTFVIDAEGVIRYAHRAIAGLTFRPVSELIQELDKLR